MEEGKEEGIDDGVRTSLIRVSGTPGKLACGAMMMMMDGVGFAGADGDGLWAKAGS